MFLEILFMWWKASLNIIYHKYQNIFVIPISQICSKYWTLKWEIKEITTRTWFALALARQLLIANDQLLTFTWILLIPAGVYSALKLWKVIVQAQNLLTRAEFKTWVELAVICMAMKTENAAANYRWKQTKVKCTNLGLPCHWTGLFIHDIHQT